MQGVEGSASVDKTSEGHDANHKKSKHILGLYGGDRSREGEHG